MNVHAYRKLEGKHARPIYTHYFALRLFCIKITTPRNCQTNIKNLRKGASMS